MPFRRELKAYACRPKQGRGCWVGNHYFPEGEPVGSSKPLVSTTFIDENDLTFHVSYTAEQVEQNRERSFGMFCPFMPLLLCGPMDTIAKPVKPKPVLTFRTQEALSASISIHVSSTCLDDCIKHGVMQCPTSFQLSRWVPFSIDQFHLTIWDRVIETQRIVMPIDACWVERFERRSISEARDLKTCCVITAGDLQGLKLYADGADKNATEYAQAVGVFMRALPKEWPIMVYAV